MITGAIIFHGKAELPSGFLLCDGSAVSRTAYSALFAIVGETYGAGDTTTTFNLPDLGTKMVVSYKNADSDFGTLGQSGGAKTANLQHSHTMNNHTHAFSSGSTAGPSATIARTSGSQVNSATSTHTHTVSASSCTVQTNTGTANGLTTTQSVLMKSVTLYPLIKT